MQDKLFGKVLVLTIIVLFVGANVTPSICGTNSKIITSEIEKNIVNKDILSIKQISSSSLTFHTFDKSERKQSNIVLPTDIANDIFNMLEELRYKVFYEPNSEETQALKNDFIDLLDEYGLIPIGSPKSDMLRLLNPFDFKNKQNTYQIINRFPVLTGFLSSINKISVGLQQFFRNFLGKIFFNNFDTNPLLSYSGTATATFCSIVSGGNGAILPLFLLPRPRIVATWAASDAFTLVGELLTGKGFGAGGSQTGTLVGFIGMGLTYALPGYSMYGFIGYAVYTKINAEHIDFYEPPNQVPVISDENPPSGSLDVPLSLSELSFRISDADGDRMDYTVTTNPDIGSGSGKGKKDGVYTVPISGLESLTGYSWTVEVTDGKDTTVRQFNFFTVQGPPFDPFDEGWQYRKKITINHNKVDGNLDDFPVLISVVDSDLRDKSQDDGDDILFMDNVGIANKLFHEIEYFDDSSSNLVAWVNVPSVSSSVDTVFYMYYGNPSCSSQQFPEMVWDSDYKLVYHLDETSGHHQDSTANNADSTAESVTVQGSAAGKIGGADEFERDNADYVAAPNVGSLNTFTLEMWAKYESYVKYEELMGKEKYIGFVTGYDDYHLGYNVGDGAWGNPVDSGAGAIETGIWYYIVGTSDGTNIELFIDSDSKGTAENSDDFNADFHLGERYANKYNFDGIMDEVRVSATERSQDWITTSYNTMNDPSSFLSFGPEE